MTRDLDDWELVRAWRAVVREVPGAWLDCRVLGYAFRAVRGRGLR